MTSHKVLKIPTSLYNENLLLFIKGIFMYQTFITFSGMNECSVHNFIGRCSEETLQSIFPRCEERFITAEELKQSIVFEQSAGYEDIVQHFFTYLLELEKYEPGE